MEALMGIVRRWLALGAEAEQVTKADPAAQAQANIVAATQAYYDFVKESGLSCGSSFSLSSLATWGGDSDVDNPDSVLFCLWDGCCDWYILVMQDSGYAEVVAFYCYDTSVWGDDDSMDAYEMSVVDETVAKVIQKRGPQLLAKDNREERHAAMREWAEKRGRGGYHVVKANEELRYTLGVIYPAAELDAHGDYATAEDLEKSAWGFISKANAGLDHADGTDGEGTVVESYIYRGPDWEIGGQVVKAGDWLGGVIWSEAAWPSIRDGERTGYSLQGWARSAPVEESELAA